MAKKKDGLLPVIIVMVALLIVSIGFLAIYNAWVNRELTPEEDAAQIAGKYNGGTITKGEIMEEYGTLAYTYYMLYGTTEGYESTLLNEAAYNTITKILMPLKAKDLGLDALDEAEQAKLDADVETQYEEYVTMYTQNYLTEEQKALAEDEQRAAAIELLEGDDFTKEFVRDQLLRKIYDERLYAYATADVTVADEDLQAEYDTRLAADQESYGADAGYYASRVNTGVTSLVTPEGVRSVKHILVKPTDELLSAFTSAKSALSTAQSEIATLEEQIASGESEAPAEPTAEPTAAPETSAAPDASTEPTEAPVDPAVELEALKASLPELEAAIETARVEALASVQAKLDEINTRLAAGEAFETLLAEYGEDPGMQQEPAMTNGYYVAEGVTTWVEEFTSAAMALEKIGDYSQPVLSSSGVHIIYYNADLPAGTTSLEDAHDYIYNIVDVNKKDATYSEKMNEWIEEYDFAIYSDVLSN